MPFRTLADAMVLRNHLIYVLEEADVEGNPELRRQLLTFVVGGGGFSGVDVMAELNDFVRSVKKNYLRLRDEPDRCVIVQAGANPYSAGNVGAAGGFCPKNFAPAWDRDHSQ